MSSDDEHSNSSGRAASADEAGSDIDDLFGDGGGSEEEQEPPKRRLDDEELDSADDEDRNDRMEFGSPIEDEPPVERELQIAPIVLPRHPVPEPSDNELYLLKVPPFLSIEPHLWQTQNFRPPNTHHHSKLPPTTSFSAYDTAMTTIRWRHSPSEPDQLQSNARILRWSDGSLTLQLASDPTAQYQISAKPLAPPQVDPPKPVPMAAAAKSIKSKAGTNGASSGYDPKRDTFSYLAEPSEAAYVLRVTRHFTTALDIRPNSKTESLESLQVQMSAAVSKYQSTFANEDGGAAAMIATGGSGLKIEDIRDDPEKLKKEALKQEREMERKIRKEERDREKNMKIGRATGRFGGVGLSMEGLEGESGAGGGRRGGNRGGVRARRSRRDEFSEEEEELYGRRGGPEDQYDMDDGFLASDDEDDDETGGSEDAEGEEDIDDVIERQEKQRAAEKKKSDVRIPAGNVSPKRRADVEDAADAGQDSPLARAKRRRVVDSEDESD